MRAHCNDLRAEAAKDFGLLHDGEADQFTHLIAKNWSLAGLPPEDQALCMYAEKLTKTPKEMNDEDVQALKEMGWDDDAIHDATQVISYFNYINRIADALDVDLEEHVHAWEQGPPERDVDV